MRSSGDNTQKGFTLVELSIVLVIIGLVVGGILVGRDLIRANELRAVISEVQKFSTAVNAFKLKFNCLPGDCAEASNLGLGTSGNGNGMIDLGWCANPADTSGAGNVEIFLFWQHLANANLIPGNFTGLAGSGNAIAGIINTNVPPSKFPGGGYSVSYFSPGGPQCSPYTYANALSVYFITFGAQKSADFPLAPLLTTFEAYTTDQKIDDGLPGTGKILTMNSSWFNVMSYGATNCTTSDTPTTATYNLTNKSPACNLLFTRAF